MEQILYPFLIFSLLNPPTTQTIPDTIHDLILAFAPFACQVDNVIIQSMAIHEDPNPRALETETETP